MPSVERAGASLSQHAPCSVSSRTTWPPRRSRCTRFCFLCRATDSPCYLAASPHFAPGCTFLPFTVANWMPKPRRKLHSIADQSMQTRQELALGRAVDRTWQLLSSMQRTLYAVQRFNAPCMQCRDSTHPVCSTELPQRVRPAYAPIEPSNVYRDNHNAPLRLFFPGTRPLCLSGFRCLLPSLGMMDGH